MENMFSTIHHRGLNLMETTTEYDVNDSEIILNKQDSVIPLLPCSLHLLLDAIFCIVFVLNVLRCLSGLGLRSLWGGLTPFVLQLSERALLNKKRDGDVCSSDLWERDARSVSTRNRSGNTRQRFTLCRLLQTALQIRSCLVLPVVSDTCSSTFRENSHTVAVALFSRATTTA